MKKIVIATILLSSIFGACRKKDNPIVEPTPVLKTYLSKWITSNGTSIFEYDTQNRIIAEIFTSANEATSPSFRLNINSYDNTGKVLTMFRDYVSPTVQDMKFLRFYNAAGQRDSFARVNNTTGVIEAAGKFTNTGNAASLIQYTTGNVLQNGKLEYTFSADGKNIIEQRSYTPATTITLQFTAEYNDKFSAQSLLPVGYDTYPSSINTITTSTFKYFPSGTINNYTYLNDYNADGYITKLTLSGSTNAQYFEYVKK
jgi:hypothetical protein